MLSHTVNSAGLTRTAPLSSEAHRFVRLQILLLCVVKTPTFCATPVWGPEWEEGSAAPPAAGREADTPPHLFLGKGVVHRRVILKNLDKA
mgnify:CR=1 FL=1